MSRIKFLIVACLLGLSVPRYAKCESEEAESPPPEDEPITINLNDITSDPEQDDGVHVLTDANFDAFVNTKPVVLIEFYAPWCGHCKTLAPKYAKAAKTLAQADPPVPLAKVDCTTEEKVASKFGIQGYPSLKIFRDGKPEDYDGPREEEGIVEHMKQKSDPNYKPPPEEVITLTKDNFAEVTLKEDFMLVEFYAPWCGHCKKIAPELEKAAKQLKPDGIKIAKLDATAHTEIGQMYGVSGYPTMKIFRKGVPSEFKGGREAAEIVTYMRRHNGDPSELVTTLKEVKKYVKKNGDEPVMLGVFENENDPMLKLYFDANSEIRDDFVFGHTFDPEAKAAFNLASSAIMVFHPPQLHSKYEPTFHALTDAAATVEQVQAFYTEHQVPLVGNFQSHTEARFAKRPLVLVFYDVDFTAKMRSVTQYTRNRVVEVAHNNPDVLFAVAEEVQFEQRLKDAGLEETGEDVNVVYYDKNDRRFPMYDVDFSEDSLQEFIDDCKAGNVKPKIKSQKAPKKQKDVKVVVGDNFDDIVMDESKEVLLEFYAPWCGHCKSLTPIYNKLAKKYKKHKNLVIAKIDATANEAPAAYKAEGFPTIYWAPPGKKDAPVKFEGGREIADFDKFLTENSAIVGEGKKKDEL